MKSIIRKLAFKLGIRKLFLPIQEFDSKREAIKHKKRYDPLNTHYGLNKDKRDFEITVSFTTFPARITNAVYVADAMLRQTLKPDRVIMVLASDEVQSKDDLPEEYINLQKRGLSIVFAENLRPHNKYQHAMKNYPDSIVITVDDDVFYPNDLVETLFSSYSKYPEAVSVIRAHRILFKDKKILPYNEWGFESIYTDKPVFDLLATGVGGALYPPMCMAVKRDILFDADVIRRISLNADDIWLKIIELLCDVPVVLAKQKPPSISYIPDTQNTSLHSSNVDSKKNDVILHDTISYFGINEDELYNKMKNQEDTVR